ncbi:MAG TPA: hypothetical protein PKX10_02135 [Propioniciclava tarda]|nr:hypothetical protein [Propioniciclava tarda]HQD59916.1 hypothetical protein [Propioniciclava tarda]
MKNRLVSVVLGTVVLGAAVGMNIAQAPAAEAASCYVSPIYLHSAYNVNCTWAQHWLIGNGTKHFGAKVPPSVWSTQRYCYASETDYGADSSRVRSSAV